MEPYSSRTGDEKQVPFRLERELIRNEDMGNLVKILELRLANIRKTFLHSPLESRGREEKTKPYLVPAFPQL